MNARQRLEAALDARQIVNHFKARTTRPFAQIDCALGQLCVDLHIGAPNCLTYAAVAVDMHGNLRTLERIRSIDTDDVDAVLQFIETEIDNAARELSRWVCAFGQGLERLGWSMQKVEPGGSTEITLAWDQPLMTWNETVDNMPGNIIDDLKAGIALIENETVPLPPERWGIYKSGDWDLGDHLDKFDGIAASIGRMLTLVGVLVWTDDTMKRGDLRIVSPTGTSTHSFDLDEAPKPKPFDINAPLFSFTDDFSTEQLSEEWDRIEEEVIDEAAAEAAEVILEHAVWATEFALKSRGMHFFTGNDLVEVVRSHLVAAEVLPEPKT